jgi:hypothetical protein
MNALADLDHDLCLNKGLIIGAANVVDNMVECPTFAKATIMQSRPLFASSSYQRSTSLLPATRCKSVVSRACATQSYNPKKDVWRKYSLICLAGLLVSHFFLTGDHETATRHDYAHMRNIRKEFPFRDGRTPLFGERSEHEH